MALPPSGNISMSQVNVELGKPADANSTLNDTDVRTLAGVPTPNSTISMAMLHGKSSKVGIPVGGVLFYNSTAAAPSGFSDFYSADGYPLKGSSGAIGAVAGSIMDKTASISASTHAHSWSNGGSQDNITPNWATASVHPTSGKPSLSVKGSGTTPIPAQGGSHGHDAIAVSVKITEPPPFEGFRLIIANEVSDVPTNAGVLRLSSPAPVGYTQHRSMRAQILGGGKQAGVVNDPKATITVTPYANQTSSGGLNHNHGYIISDLGTQMYYPPVVRDFRHVHQLSPMSDRFTIKYDWTRVFLFFANAVTEAAGGIIIGYVGDGVPSGWSLVTDLVDRYLEISNLTSLASAMSSTTPQQSLFGVPFGGNHTHIQDIDFKFGGTVVTKVTFQSAGQDGTHNHSAHVGEITDMEFRHYNMKFIEFIG